MRGMPRPLSWRSRRGSVAAGSASRRSGSKPRPWSTTWTVTWSSSITHRTTTGSSRTVAASCASMALEQASETATSRSATRARGERADGGVDDEADERQVGGPGRDLQLDDRHASRSGHGRVDVGQEGQGLVEARDLEQAGDARLRAHDAEVAAVRPGALERADDGAEARRGEGVDLGEVEHEVRGPLAHEPDEDLAQLGRRGDVDLAVDGDDGPAADLGHLGTQLHGALTLSCPRRVVGASRGYTAGIPQA